MSIEVITTNKEASALVKDLSRKKIISGDIETEGFEFTRERQIMLQLGDQKTQNLIDTRTVDIQLFKPLLENQDIIKLFHSSEFDGKWMLYEHGIRLRNIGDTKLAENIKLGVVLDDDSNYLTKDERAIFEPAYSASLSACLNRRGLPSKLEFEPFYWYEPIIVKNHLGKVVQIVQDKTGPLHKWSDGQIMYSGRDIEFLEVLWEDQLDSIEQWDMDNVLKLEMVVAEITIQMSANGFGIDVQGWYQFAQETLMKANEMKVKLEQLFHINWNAPGQVSEVFGVQYIKEARLCPVISDDKTQKAWDLWMEWNKHNQNIKTFGLSWLRHMSPDGRVHASFNQLVSTGRYSCKYPNLQNIPAKTPHRSFFVPSHYYRNLKMTTAEFNKPREPITLKTPYQKGITSLNARSFGIMDFASQELAIIAAGSQDPTWLDVLRSEPINEKQYKKLSDIEQSIYKEMDGHKGMYRKDLHAVTARLTFADWATSDSSSRKKKRRLVKDINFGIAYGMGAPGFSVKAGCSVEEAGEILTLYKNTFPMITEWLRLNGSYTVRTEIARSFPPFNRMRYTAFESEDWRRSNIGKNTPVQGTGADMTKLAMAYLYKYQLAWEEGKKELNGHKLCDFLIIHQMHDELVVECDDNDIPTVENLLKTAALRACTKILGEPLSQPEIKFQKNWDKREE